MKIFLEESSPGLEITEMGGYMSNTDNSCQLTAEELCWGTLNKEVPHYVGRLASGPFGKKSQHICNNLS